MRIQELLLAAAPLAGGASRFPAQDVEARAAELATVLEELAERHRIPGMSAAIVHQEQLAWSAGFGLADLENEVWATPRTRYRIASVSKPMAAVLVMQLVEEGKLALDAPMKDFRVHAWFGPDPARYAAQPVRVRHVLDHTSEGVPGDAYAYNGNAFVDLTWVLEDVTRTAYPRLLQERVFQRAGMVDSTPGHARPGESEHVALTRAYAPKGEEYEPATYQMIDPHPELDLAGFDPVFRLPDEAQAARRELLGERFAHLNGVSSSSGVITTVEDLARFDIALDSGELVSAESRERMFTPSRSNSGALLPYGLGWFVEELAGRKVCWHYGWLPPSVSALYVKVPAAELSFFLLANNDGLSKGFAFSREGVRASPFARAFLAAFELDGE